MIEPLKKSAKARMDKALDALKQQFIRVRTGRASPGLLDVVRVDSYGSEVPLSQIATVSVEDARTLSINPFDKKQTAAIERAISGRPDHFFARATVAEMAEIVRDLSRHEAKGLFSAAQFRDRVDNGRKVAIQILEFFDRHGLTIRRGDMRRLNPHRADLFREPPLHSEA